MSEFTSWTAHTPPYKGTVSQDQDTDKKRLIAIIAVCILVFSLVAGTAAFLGKRYHDLKQQDKEDYSKGSHSSGDHGTQIFTNIFNPDDLGGTPEEMGDASTAEQKE